MSKDSRPSNCRDRLKDEGKEYPRSNCGSCGSLMMSECPHRRKSVQGEILNADTFTLPGMMPHKYSSDEISFLQSLLDRYSELGGVIELMNDHEGFMNVVRKHYDKKKLPPSSTCATCEYRLPFSYNGPCINCGSGARRLVSLEDLLASWDEPLGIEEVDKAVDVVKRRITGQEVSPATLGFARAVAYALHTKATM